jgi:ABC-type transport system involved in cytochrome c biogenesis permease subunit
VCWLVLLGTAGYQFGRLGFGAVLGVSMAVLFCVMLFQYHEERRSQLELYRQGGNHVMLAGVGLLQVGVAIDGSISRPLGAIAVCFICTGLAMIATWWRSDRATCRPHDRQL